MGLLTPYAGLTLGENAERTAGRASLERLTEPPPHTAAPHTATQNTWYSRWHRAHSQRVKA